MIGTERRADRFARLLDSGSASDDPSVAPLLAAAVALRALPAAGAPTDDFRADLRRRMLAVATVQGLGATAATPPAGVRLRSAASTWRVQRRLTAVAAGAAAAVAVAGVGVGASRSLPGQAFYGIKRATEDVQLAATHGTVARGERHLGFARARLAEVQQLAGAASSLARQPDGHAVAAGAVPADGNARLIDSTLRSMDEETRAGAADLLAAARSTRSAAPLQILDRFTRKQYAALSSLLPALPAAARPDAVASLQLLRSVAASAVATAVGSLPARSPGSAPTPSSAPPASTTPGPSSSASPAPAPAGDGSSGAGTPKAPATGGPRNPGLPTVTPPPITPPSVPAIPPLPTLPALQPGGLVPTSLLPTSLLPTSLLPTSLLPTAGLLGS